MTYKFMAETLFDAVVLDQRNPNLLSNMKLQKMGQLADVEIVFDSDMGTNEIIEIMRTVPDGHVMYQTVKPIEEYTGERNYDL